MKSSSKPRKGSTEEVPLFGFGSITVVRSPRARRVSIQVVGRGDVRLVMPLDGDLPEAIKMLEANVERVWAMQDRVLRRAKNVGYPFSESEVAAMRVSAKEFLPRRTAELAAQHGFEYGRVTIRAARAKWGCCTSEKNLSLSLFIMQLPSHLIDFVILHELTHTIHLNHSAEFHAALDRVMGGREKICAKQLQGYIPGHSYLETQDCDY